MADRPATLTHSLAAPAELDAIDRARLLQWLILLRVVVSFIILYTTYVLYAPQSLALQASVSVIGSNVLVSLLSAVFIDRKANSNAFVLFQLYWDFLFVSALVFVTGGFDSLFNFLYILTIIFTAILTSQGQTMGMALVCSAMYAAILVAQRTDLLHPLGNLGILEAPSDREISVKISLNALAFISMGVLASYLSSRGREANLEVQRQRTEMETLKSLNESIVKSLPIGLLTCDENDIVTFANEHVSPILGRANDLVRGKQLGELLPMLSPDAEEGAPFDVENVDSHDDTRTLSVTTNPLRSAAGGRIGRVLTVQDITGIRELESFAKQADRQAAVGKLAAGIAHEIRNPLASMSGSIQLLKSELDLEPVHAHLMQIVLRETDRLNALINDFLDYARPTIRKDTVADLAAVIDEQLGVMANDPACANVTIEKHLDKDLVCRFDPDQIRQLFWNLFLNSLQAMEDRPGTLTVTARVSQKHSGFIEVNVNDTGVGMPAEVVDLIFDPFFTTKNKGTGLGLTSAYRIVENHSGRILVHSKLGQGTTMDVLLPQ